MAREIRHEMKREAREMRHQARVERQQNIPGTAPDASTVTLRLINMVFAGIVAVSALVFGHSWVAPIALLAWFLVEVVNQGKHSQFRPGAFIINVGTLGIMGAIVLSALATGASWVAPIALLAWFLIEAIRN